MDEAKPSTSYEGFDNVPPNVKDLLKRLFDAVDIAQVETLQVLRIFRNLLLQIYTFRILVANLWSESLCFINIFLP